MTVFVFLALAASLVLLILEGAWLARLPPEKYHTLIRRTVYISLGLVVLGMVAFSTWHWMFVPVGVVLLFGDRWHNRVFRNPDLRQQWTLAVNGMTHFFSHSRAALNDSARAQKAQQPPPPAPRSNDMSPEMARRILGLPERPTEQQVKDAHRRLMRRVHPDRGGSSAKAAQINRAKDVLLGN